MEADSALPASHGGSVEPAHRGSVAKPRFQAPAEPAVTHYELRDHFAEVTYRRANFDDMVAKAEQLGAIRFHAVDPQGNRSAVQKVGGTWKADVARAAAPPAPVKDDARERSSAAPADRPAPSIEPRAAKVDADAEREARVARLEAALLERYVVKRAPIKVGDVALGHTEYRYRGDTSRIAFTESTFKLSTDNNSPSVARSMVDVAEARAWKALRVSGHDDFKRMVWLEASLRGVRIVGYEPHQADHELLHREREVRAVNRIEPVHAGSQGADAAAAKQSARGSGGRKAVLAALEAVLVAKRVPEKQREAVMTAAAENLAQRLRDGQTHKVKVYDHAAPSQRPFVPSPEVQRTRDRAAPVR